MALVLHRLEPRIADYSNSLGLNHLVSELVEACVFRIVIVGCGTILVVVLLGLRFMAAGSENQWTSVLFNYKHSMGGPRSKCPTFACVSIPPVERLY